MKGPFFSIVIPTYNRAQKLKVAIQSVISQEYKDFEIIVVDDGGTDDSRQIVNSFSDKRIRYFWKENEERSIARNFGIRKAKGEYVNFLDSDDYQFPNHLRTAFSIIEKRINPEIIHLGYQLEDSSGNVLMKRGNLSNQGLLKIMVHENILHGNALFIKRNIVLEYQFINSPFAFLSEDWYLWMKLLVRYKVVFSDIITSVVVDHEQRSLKLIDADKLVTCTHLIVKHLKDDNIFISRLGYRSNTFFANQYTFLTLVLALVGKRNATCQYLMKAIQQDVTVVFRKRFLASFKHLVKSYFKRKTRE